MKIKNRLLSLVLVPLMIMGTQLVSCGSDAWGPDETADTLVLPSNVVSDFVADSTDYSNLVNEDTNILRFHYHRSDDLTGNRGSYVSWQIWAWDMTNGGNGAAYTFDTYDDYGVFVDIPVSSICGDKTPSEIGFLVAITSTWNKDPDGDRSIEVSYQELGGIQNIWLKSGSSKIYPAMSNALKSAIKYARLYTQKQVRVLFDPLNSETFKTYKPRFSVTLNGEPYKDFSVSGYDVSLIGATLTFKNNIKLTDKVDISYYFDPEWTDTTTMILTSFFDSEEFIDNYTYDGTDLGVTLDSEITPTKTTFKVWAPTSTAMLLNIYNTGDYRTETAARNTYTMTEGDKGVWSYVANENLSGKYYTYTVTNTMGTNEVVDPYAQSAGLNGRRGMIVNWRDVNASIPGWSNDARPDFGTNGTDASIYEIHVRDMTINPNSGVSEANRGKFLGLTETGTTYESGGISVSTGLDHLKELGITHVQIQPFYDYTSVDETNVSSSMSVNNYNWGYDPQNYNCLEGSYSSDPTDGYARIREFKQMVMAMHNYGISINMDVVYNHTGSTLGSNFTLLVPYYYYRTTSGGEYYNGSGCGNVVASERKMVASFIRQSCEMWTDEYHLSGFRFDLMGCMDNQIMINIYQDCKAIYDKVMIYGEPWTGGNADLSSGVEADNLSRQQTVQRSLAQSYFAGSGNYVGAFNDVIRNAIKGSNGPDSGYVQGMTGTTATNIVVGTRGQFSANSDLEKNIEPQQVLNYVSCHDNYTLYDHLNQTKGSRNLVNMYKQAETIVFTAQGVPFMQEGEDFMRTKQNVGNSYNVGDLINNMDYSLKVTNNDMFQYFKNLIALRKAHDGLTLSTRAEITASLTECTKYARYISTKIDTNSESLWILHAVNSINVDLGSSYEVLLSTNAARTVGEDLSTINLATNESIILRKN